MKRWNDKLPIFLSIDLDDNSVLEMKGYVVDDQPKTRIWLVTTFLRLVERQHKYLAFYLFQGRGLLNVSFERFFCTAG